MTFFLGIDPGKKGALAVLSTEAGAVNVFDMPATTAELHNTIASLPIIRGCVIEKPFYPPSIGIKTATTIAEAYGTLIGALHWRDIPYRVVAPNKWKGELDLSKDKGRSREHASRMFPDQSEVFRLVKHDGRAEAALLAVYASERRMWGKVDD